MAHSQRTTVASMAVAAGLWCQAPTFWLSAAPSASAKTAMGRGVGFIRPK